MVKLYFSMTIPYQFAKAVFKYTLRVTTDIEICLC